MCRGRPNVPREAGEHHLFPRLVAPPHVLGRVGIRLVRGRVVIPRRRLDLRPRRQLERTSELILVLPIEVVVRHREDRLGAPVGIDRLVVPPDAAHVRVRGHAEQQEIAVQRHLSVDAVIGRAGGNVQRAVDQSRARQRQLRRLLREDQPHLRPVRRLLADRRVVHLEDERRALGAAAPRCRRGSSAWSSRARSPRSTRPCPAGGAAHWDTPACAVPRAVEVRRSVRRECPCPRQRSPPPADVGCPAPAVASAASAGARRR